MPTLRPPFKIHGGKFYLSDWVIGHFPDNYEQLEYSEIFAGGASVLINKKPSKHEVINDIDPGVVVIFKTLRDHPEEFVAALKRLRYTSNTFLKALDAGKTGDPLTYAVNEFVVRRMSRGGLKKAFGWSDRERGGQPGDVNAWKTILGILPTIAQRIKNVSIFNQGFEKMISTFDNETALFYCDPPYLQETRTSGGYEFEMTEADHTKLAELLVRCRGKVVVSGYPSSLYGSLYKGWRCVKKEIANHASQKKMTERKTEVLWLNF